MTEGNRRGDRGRRGRIRGIRRVRGCAPWQSGGVFEPGLASLSADDGCQVNGISPETECPSADTSCHAMCSRRARPGRHSLLSPARKPDAAVTVVRAVGPTDLHHEAMSVAAEVQKVIVRSDQELGGQLRSARRPPAEWWTPRNCAPARARRRSGPRPRRQRHRAAPRSRLMRPDLPTSRHHAMTTATAPRTSPPRPIARATRSSDAPLRYRGSLR